jgi:enterochelin esterase-like enzyme
MMKQLFIIAFSLVFTLVCKSDKDIQSELESHIEFKKLDNALLAGGSLFRVHSFPSNYITPRPVDVWLPNGYSKNKTYNVLYMHDGQNLFDSTTTWNKQEWKVDDWATQLMSEGKIKDFIVVGIHNIPQIRWQDLFPQKAFEVLDTSVQEKLLNEAINANMNTKFNGDNYLKFIVEELKPIIDKQYSVYTNKPHTFVSGSSMGGLMSMYAISEYPEVFGGAACLSTHWVGAEPREDNQLPEGIFQYMETSLPKAGSHKLYFDYGNKTLDEHYPQYAPRVDEILNAKGYTKNDSKNLFFEGTDHSENSWNKRLDLPLIFLLGR